MKGSRLAIVVIFIALAALIPVVAGMAAPAPQKGGPVSDLPIVVGSDYKHDLSQPLSEIQPLPVPASKGEREANENPRVFGLPDLEKHEDPVVQSSIGAQMAMPGTTVSFDGIGYPGVNCNCAPPDTNGDVGPNHYVQTVNTGFQIWSKTGTSLYGPAAINTIWSGFGGTCQTSNDGDPIVLYDSLANRWVISQFTATSPYDLCVAVSQTGDPTGAWYRYAFQLSTSDFPDYPHMGVWSDGYYVSENWFTGGTTWAGPRPYVFNRSAMLTGAAATFQTTAASLGSSVTPIMPADVDGPTAPPAGAPNVFIGTPSTAGTMPTYKFHVDWTTPANTTWTRTNITSAAYTALCTTSRACVPQSGTTARLDGIGDRIMFRAAYRNFGDHESLVTNMSVSSGGVAAVRWYELRGLSGTVSVYQQGTFQPDTTYRWMGSAAMDRQGNIAVGYSASSASIFPAIRYAGRLATDPLNVLSQGEGTLIAGTGSQTATHNRWGDYSGMAVDPADECTFWYTNEYYTTSGSSWRTRIGAFKFPGCTSGPTPTPGPSSTPTRTPLPPTATNTPAPSNDDFNSATNIGALPFTGTANTSAYTTAADDPASCAGTPSTGGHTAWYKYVPSASQTLALDTFTSNYDTMLGVFTGTRGALTRRACNDDASGGTQSQITGLAVAAGTTYYIEIASYGTSAGGSLVLHVSGSVVATSTPAPPTPTFTPAPPTATPGTCPNASGGYCRTNNEARAWIAGGTNQSITSDDQVKAVALPFTFTFAGTAYGSINVSSNGNAHFGTASSAYSNVAIPSTAAPNAMIAPFWDDLSPAVGGAVYTAVSGTAPNRVFVIEWRNVAHYGGTTDGVTFEIQLVESTNHIWLLYQDVSFANASYNSGVSATVGVENAGGTAGNQYSYNSASLTNTTVLHFWPQ